MIKPDKLFLETEKNIVIKNKVNQNSFKNQPSEEGKFGNYGGMFVAETLMPLILEVSKSYTKLKKNKLFREKLIY